MANQEIVLSCPARWVWLLAGIAVGIFVSFLFYIQVLAPGAPSTSIQDILSANQASADVKKTDIAEKSQSDRYLLQVGSYRDEYAANGMKDYLVSLGIDAKVEQTTFGEEGRWYRVQVGPLSDLNKLKEIRAKLEENGIEANIRQF